jgi:hypothetical protein
MRTARLAIDRLKIQQFEYQGITESTMERFGQNAQTSEFIETPSILPFAIYSFLLNCAFPNDEVTRSEVSGTRITNSPNPKIENDFGFIVSSRR